MMFAPAFWKFWIDDSMRPNGGGDEFGAQLSRKDRLTVLFLAFPISYWSLKYLLNGVIPLGIVGLIAIIPPFLFPPKSRLAFRRMTNFATGILALLFLLGPGWGLNWFIDPSIYERITGASIDIEFGRR